MAIVIMSGGKDSRIGVPRATLPTGGFCCPDVVASKWKGTGKATRICQIWCFFAKTVWDIRW